MPAYFERLSETSFRASPKTSGAWNPNEQHVAPSLGLLTHEIERDRARRGSSLQLARLSYDILGVMPIGVVDVEVRVLRPGRTIELVEATLSHDGRPAVVGRVWLMQATDTTAPAGSTYPAMPARADLGPWNGHEEWDGIFVGTHEVVRHEPERGHAQVWVRPSLPLLQHETISPTARMMGIVDITNGMATRLSPETAMYPNLDVTVHLFRKPATEWIGFDTTVSVGPNGVGLTSTVLHDENGPIGTSGQSLTIRPRG